MPPTAQSNPLSTTKMMSLVGTFISLPTIILVLLPVQPIISLHFLTKINNLLLKISLIITTKTDIFRIKEVEAETAVLLISSPTNQTLIKTANKMASKAKI